MAAIGALLMGKVLGQSEAEKAFRPWWDSFEDHLIYGLVMMGVIIVPTAIITGSPLDCNYCQDNYCTSNGKNPQYNNDNRTNPGNNEFWWVKQYCTMNGVEPFLLYFPYFLLVVALSLFFIETLFVKGFKSGAKLEKFHSILMREKVLPGADLTEGDQGTGDGGMDEIELRQSFRESNSYFYSYLFRTMLEIVVATLLLVYMIIGGIPVLDDADTIICDVHGYYYECSGQPAQFYRYILYLTCIITITYIVCNIYNFLWLVIPYFGNLSRFMSTYRSNMKMMDSTNHKTDKELLGDLYDIYYDNRDLRLLLDLLATSSGVAPAVAIMSLFDQNFRNSMNPKISYIAASRDLGIVEVQFQEPKTGVRAALDDIPGVHLLYVAEIVPPVKTAVEAFESQYVPQKETGAGTGADIEHGPLYGYIQRACFEGLKKDVKYTIKVSTVVNGKTICQVSEELAANHEKLPPDNAPIPEVNEQGECLNSCNILSTC